MDSDIIEVVTEWESSPVSGGYDGLRTLADQGFTGAVSEGMVWAFVLNGKVVGVFDGDITAFEDADGTAYHAPDPALPLLYAMQETGGETRAQYYTNDTPISAADSTLSSGKFTGYIELSENVLSGDYYVVYYGGKSMSVAYVGNSRKLLTGDEAFQRADDEVGIYKVNEATIEVVDIPEPESDPEPVVTDDANAAVGGDVDTADAEDETTDDADDDRIGAGVTFDGTDGVDEADVEGPETATADESAVAADVDETSEPTTETAETADADASITEDDHEVETEPPTELAPEPTASEHVENSTSTAPDEPERPSVEEDVVSQPTESAGAVEQPAESSPGPEADSESEQADDDPLAPSAAAANGDPDDDVFSEEAQWREATSIPALDPQDSAPESDESGPSGQQAAVSRRDASARSQRRTRQDQSKRTQERRRRQQSSQSTEPEQSTNDGANPQVGQLKARLEAVAEEKSELESARERLVAEVDRLEDERDQAAQERDEYRERAETLQSRVSSLESEVDRLESELEEARAAGVAGSAGTAMSAEAALDGTNLFVRYGSKSGGTLEKAHAGEVNRSEVNENLRLEHHTGFETEGVVVDGESYEEFLHGSIEYGFVRWVVEDLLYEIRETGNRGSLDELFDAIPKIDRAELHGEVTLKYTEGGEEHREQQSFDVVLRDRMGNPLLVANLNGSRDPASEGMMRSLVEHTSRLRESNDSLGAAFLVTASYFAPDALETAADATGGGLLSRGRRKSFVKLSRKQGFHLCLVETRNGDFHVNVPEL